MKRRPRLGTRKPVFLLLPGPSLEELESRIPRLQDLDVNWASLNRFNLLEEKLGILFNLVYISSPVRVEELKEEIVHLLRTSGIFVTNSQITAEYEHLYRKARNMGSPSTTWYCTNLAYEPGVWHNSLTAFLLWLSNMGFKEIYLFGCDGGKVGKNGNIYYGQELIDTQKEQFDARKLSIPRDTQLMNEQYWSLYKKYFVQNKPKIINVNDDSLVTCFDKLTWGEFDALVHAASTKSL